MSRAFPLTGAQAVASLTRAATADVYSFTPPATTHVPLAPLLIDEPTSDQVVHMLDALPACESRFYANER